jgi:chromate transporter
MSPPALTQIFFSFLRLGLTAFGGPAMIAYIKTLSVKKKQWLNEARFRDGLALCQSLPGATAMQMAAYVGLQARGVTGALAAFIGFGLPAFGLMLIFFVLYANYRDLSFIQAIFSGLQVLVVSIIAMGTYTFGKTLAKNVRGLFLSALSALALGLGLSPFLVIPGAGLISILLWPNQKIAPTSENPDDALGKLKKGGALFGVAAVLMALLFWIDPRYFLLSALMMKIDLFAFGGGFTSVPLMLHEIVQVRGWIDEKTFLDGIALGQVTPGPIVITATFVGYLLYGFWGSLLATLGIFTPSFVLLTLADPFFDRLKSSALFVKATQGILASFVGLLLFALIKFSLAVSWDIFKLLMAGAALGALMKKVDLLYVVLAGALLSLWLFR